VQRRVVLVIGYVALAVIAHVRSPTPVQAADVSCHRPPPGQEIIRYQRVHHITIRRPARGPDAIEYEAVEVVSVTDELLVWHLASDTACVLLTTFDQDARECGLDGVAVLGEAGEFVFSEEACAVRLSIGADRVDVKAPKTGCMQGYCAKSGVIEDGRYVRR
jgi:hypothetical protein